MIRSLRLQHAGIKVRNLDRAIRFYSEVLGFRLRSRHEAGSHPAVPFGSAFMYLDDYHHQQAIFSVPADWVDSEGEDTVTRRAVGLHHLAFEVADKRAFDEAVACLRSREDIEIVWGPLRLDESNGLWGGHEGVYFLDPDGNRIEVFHGSDMFPGTAPGWREEGDTVGKAPARGKRPKYTPDNLLPMFRKAASLRNEMLSAGFTDNGGAIHSAERILDILGSRLNYPGLSHGNNLRDYPDAEFSPAALDAHERGEKVLIEHVSPHRAFTRRAIEKIGGGASDEELTEYIKRLYRLVLLTPEETKRLNRINRSRMTPDRLGEAGISLVKRRAPWIEPSFRLKDMPE